MLSGRAENIVRVLIPDDCAEPQGFHDILLEDMTTEIVLATLSQDMSSLRTMWPKSLLSGMSKRQADMESQRRECRCRFSDLQSRPCPHCGRVTVSSMTRHVMAYHLDLAQLWLCPVPWCSIWKGTVKDCVYHVGLRHHRSMLVKASKIGKCFSPCTVTRTAWNASLEPTVSGIATDIMLFSQHGAQLVPQYRVYGGYVPSTFFEERSCPCCPISHTGPVLRPARWPNVAGTLVPSLIRRLLVLLTVRRITPPPGLEGCACHDVCNVAYRRFLCSAPTSMSYVVLMSQLPLGPTHRMPDHASPRRGATHTATSVTSPDGTYLRVSVTTR